METPNSENVSTHAIALKPPACNAGRPSRAVAATAKSLQLWHLDS